MAFSTLPSDFLKALRPSNRKVKRRPGQQAVRVEHPQPRTPRYPDEDASPDALALFENTYEQTPDQGLQQNVYEGVEQDVRHDLDTPDLYSSKRFDPNPMPQEYTQEYDSDVFLTATSNRVADEATAVRAEVQEYVPVERETEYRERPGEYEPAPQVAKLTRTHSEKPRVVVAQPRWIPALAAFLGLFFASMWPTVMSVTDLSRAQVWGVDQNVISDTLATNVLGNSYPSNTTIQGPNRSYAAVMQYGFDSEVQSAAEKVIQRYRPDYAAFVAIDPKTGRVLSLVSKTRNNNYDGNLAIRGTFPAASVFKIVTAAAALDTGVLTANSITPYNGKSTTLYKTQVLRHQENKWTRKPTLRESFAKSANPVFARVGIYNVGAKNLQEYAERFGFNRVLPGDFPFDSGRVGSALDNDWSIAETASGFTRENTLSPLHGAMIAATALNNGIMPSPYLVEKITDDFGITMYSVDQNEGQQVVSEDTAIQLRMLMRETVKKGSARKSFKGFFKGKMAKADVGGKTGSLSGFNPKGRYDWFVGYGKLGDREIAYAALCINIEKWYVKSAYIARKVLENYLL